MVDKTQSFKAGGAAIEVPTRGITEVTAGIGNTDRAI